MNLHDLFPDNEKPVTANNILKERGTATLIKIKKDKTLAKHQSSANALLVLLEGEAVYEEENRKVELTKVHDYANIPGKVSHSVYSKEGAVLLLIQ